MTIPLAFQFKDPGSYGDWAKYAGFDRTTGNFGSAPPTDPNKPVEPVSSLSDIGQQMIAPITNTWNKISAVGSALGGGNMVDAYNAMNQSASSFGSPKPNASQSNFSTRWDG